MYEWNLPTGHTCPSANECLVRVDRETGIFDNRSNAYRCYAASAERFPGVRSHRWANFDYVKGGGDPGELLPKKCKAVRVHVSGDFFNQAYFDRWLDTAKGRPDVEFWAYTKSLRYWVERLGSIPENLVLTASYGGREDYLIEDYGLKNARVYRSAGDVPSGMPIDRNDDYARKPGIDFALLDNAFNSKRVEVV